MVNGICSSCILTFIVGFHNVILIVLRSTSNEEKFKEAIDIDIESG